MRPPCHQHPVAMLEGPTALLSWPCIPPGLSGSPLGDGHIREHAPSEQCALNSPSISRVPTCEKGCYHLPGPQGDLVARVCVQSLSTQPAPPLPHPVPTAGVL